MVDLGLLNSGKSGTAEPDRSGKPEKNFRDTLQKRLTLIVRNLFSAEMRILQGTESWFTIERGNPCQCITRNRLIPKISSWAVTQQNFVNKVKDQVRNRQKRMSNVAESGVEHSVIWGMCMATTLHAATFMDWISQLFEVFSRIMKVSTLKQMFRCHSAVGKQAGRNQWAGQNSVGQEFLDTSVLNWWWNSHQYSTHKSLCVLRFCAMSRQSSSTSWMQRSLEKPSCRSTSREELQRFWWYQRWVSGIRVEYFPRIHNVAALR